MPKDSLYEDLTISILAVNSYPLEKTEGIREGLRKQGFFHPAEVIKWDHETAIAMLMASGYDRGFAFNTRFASRLQELAIYFAEFGLEDVRNHLGRGQKEKVDAILINVHGIGPAVLRNFWALQL